MTCWGHVIQNWVWAIFGHFYLSEERRNKHDNAIYVLSMSKSSGAKEDTEGPSEDSRNRSQRTFTEVNCEK